MSPTRFELVAPPLKAECSKTNWATKTLSKWQGSNLRPDGPKPPALPNWATPRYYGGRVRCRTPYLSVPAVFKTVSQAAVITLPYCCSPGTRTPIPRTKTACPAIRRGNKIKPIFQRTFSFEVPVRFELTTPGYKAGVLPNYTKEPNFWV